jgi:hypothetical protein
MGGITDEIVERYPISEHDIIESVMEAWDKTKKLK